MQVRAIVDIRSHAECSLVVSCLNLEIDNVTSLHKGSSSHVTSYGCAGSQCGSLGPLQNSSVQVVLGAFPCECTCIALGEVGSKCTPQLARSTCRAVHGHCNALQFVALEHCTACVNSHLHIGQHVRECECGC